MGGNGILRRHWFKHLEYNCHTLGENGNLSLGLIILCRGSQQAQIFYWSMTEQMITTDSICFGWTEQNSPGYLFSVFCSPFILLILLVLRHVQVYVIITSPPPEVRGSRGSLTQKALHANNNRRHTMNCMSSTPTILSLYAVTVSYYMNMEFL